MLQLSLAQAYCRKIILSALARMTCGELVVTERGARHCFGTRSQHQEAPALIQVTSNNFWTDCVLFGHIGFAESYIKGHWNSADVKSVISWFINNQSESTLLEGSQQKLGVVNALSIFNKFTHLLNMNTKLGSGRNIEAHYDLSNELFATFLDQSMTYSCAKFTSDAQSLEDAQKAKLDSICKKLKLLPTDTVLEIGSGWGALAIHIAQTYRCRVHSITISQRQYDFVRNLIHERGLSNQVTVELKDYRDLAGSFDKVVSIEMLEAVGHEYFETFFEKINSVLKPNGLLAMQFITCPDSRYELIRSNVDFIQKHIFPGSLIPSVGRILEAANRASTLGLFELEDMGLSYEMTLDHWLDRFNASVDKVRELGFDESFIRKWRYYLQYCSAAFATRQLSVVQAVFTRPNNLSLTRPLARDDSKSLRNTTQQAELLTGV